MKIKKRFDNEANIWSNKYKNYKTNIVSYELVKRKEILVDFMKRIFAGKRIKILEIGCGSGETLKELIEIDPNWVGLGVDFSANMVSLASKYKIKRLDYKVIDFEKESLSGKYDVIYMMGVIGYFNSNNLIFNKINSILNPGGYLIFTYGNKNSLFRKIREMVKIVYPKKFYFKLYSDKEISEAVSKNYKLVSRSSICFSSGLLGPISILINNFLENVFYKGDPMNLGMTRFLILRRHR